MSSSNNQVSQGVQITAGAYQPPSHSQLQPNQFQTAPTAQPQVMTDHGPQVQQPMAMTVSPQQAPQAQVQYVNQPGQPQAIAYTAQPQPGVPQVVMNPSYFNQPDFNYTPNSFFVLSVVMAVLCGIFSPATITCTIPAVFLSLKSKNSIKAGNIKQAKREGLYSLVLIIVAILVALIVAIVFTGIFIAVGRSVNCNNAFNNYYYNRNYYYFC